MAGPTELDRAPCGRHTLAATSPAAVAWDMLKQQHTIAAADNRWRAGVRAIGSYFSGRSGGEAAGALTRRHGVKPRCTRRGDGGKMGDGRSSSLAR